MSTSLLYATIYNGEYLSSCISWSKEQKIDGMKSVEAQSDRGSEVNSIVSKHRKRNVPSPNKIVILTGADRARRPDVNK